MFHTIMLICVKEPLIPSLKFLYFLTLKREGGIFPVTPHIPCDSQPRRG